MKQFLKTLILSINFWNLAQAQTCPSPNGLFPNPNDPTCGSFLNCAHNIAWVTQCWAGLVYNPNGKYCDWPANYKCPTDDETTTTSQPNICVDPFGYYANPEDSNCKRYVRFFLFLIFQKSKLILYRPYRSVGHSVPVFWKILHLAIYVVLLKSGSAFH